MNLFTKRVQWPWTWDHGTAFPRFLLSWIYSFLVYEVLEISNERVHYLNISIYLFPSGVSCQTFPDDDFNRYPGERDFIPSDISKSMFSDSFFINSMKVQFNSPEPHNVPPPLSHWSFKNLFRKKKSESNTDLTTVLAKKEGGGFCALAGIYLSDSRNKLYENCLL